MKEILFKGTLDQCHKWADQNGIQWADLEFKPTGGATWSDYDDEWCGGGKDETDENGDALFVVTKK